MRYRAYLLIAERKLELTTVETTLRKGELLVRVKAALTCGTDTKMYLRGHAKFPFPSLFGHEMAGVVEAAGEGVKGFAAGDAVMVPVSAPCLACDPCRQGRENLCTTLFDGKVWGAFAEYCLIPARVAALSTFVKPPALPFAEAALLDPLASVVHALDAVAAPSASRVLVLGGGPMGYLHAVTARQYGHRVTVADLNEDRLAIYRGLGFPVIVAAGAWEEEGAESFDVVMECSGAPAAFSRGMRVLAPGGALCLFAGHAAGEALTFNSAALHYKHQRLIGSFHYGRKAVAAARALLVERSLPLGPLFSGTYPLERFQEVMELILEGRGMKYVIEPG
jgi:L-iditol 2-dehydrogenase